MHEAGIVQVSAIHYSSNVLMWQQTHVNTFMAGNNVFDDLV